MYRFKKNDLFGIVSYAGDVIMEPNFEEIYGFANKIGTGETKDGSLCIIDSDKVKILKHDSIEYLEGFYCERAAVDDENYNTGFINTEGELVIEQLYNRAHNFFDGVSTLMKNGLYGAIDILGNTILDFKHDYVSPYTTNGSVLWSENQWFIWKKNGVFKELGNFIDVRGAINGLIVASLESSRFIFNDRGEKLSEISNKGYEVYVAGLDTLWKKEKGVWKLSNLEGDLISDKSFKEACFYQGGVCTAKDINTQKWGIIDTNLEWKVEPKFDFIHIFDDKVAELCLGDIYGRYTSELIRLSDFSKIVIGS